MGLKIFSKNKQKNLLALCPYKTGYELANTWVKV